MAGPYNCRKGSSVLKLWAKEPQVPYSSPTTKQVLRVTITGNQNSGNT